jgi:hypothetical protein
LYRTSRPSLPCKDALELRPPFDHNGFERLIVSGVRSWNIATIHTSFGVIWECRLALQSRVSPKLITVPAKGVAMLSVLIGVLIICVVGAICFWAIEKFVNDSRLANLLKLLVVLICVGAILSRVLPLAGINWF